MTRAWVRLELDLIERSMMKIHKILARHLKHFRNYLDAMAQRINPDVCDVVATTL